MIDGRSGCVFMAQGDHGPPSVKHSSGSTQRSSCLVPFQALESESETISSPLWPCQRPRGLADPRFSMSCLARPW